MKKIALSFIFIFALSIQLFSQNTSQILSALSKDENVEKISVGSLGMFFVKLAINFDGIQSLKGITSFELLTLNDECSAKQKQKIKSQLKNMKDDHLYSTLLQVKDNDNNVRIMMKKEKDVIKEVLMFILSDKDDGVVVITVKGKIKESDLADMITEINKDNGY